jgi:hypothetical protein
LGGNRPRFLEGNSVGAEPFVGRGMPVTSRRRHIACAVQQAAALRRLGIGWNRGRSLRVLRQTGLSASGSIELEVNHGTRLIALAHRHSAADHPFDLAVRRSELRLRRE